MGPPPPNPRIEGQHSNNNMMHRRPMRSSDNHGPSSLSSASAASSQSAPLSSYASLASAPPPSFTRRSSTTATATSSSGPATGSSSSSGGGGGGPASSMPLGSASRLASSAEYHRSLSSSSSSSTAPIPTSSSSSSYRGIGSSSSTGIGGGRSAGRAGPGRYSDGGGRSAGPGRPYRGGGGAGRGGGGRFDDRPVGGRGGGRSATMDDGGGGRFSYSNGPSRRGPLGSSISSTTSSAGGSAGGGRFEGGPSRGRGRGGRDYMYASRGGGRGRSTYRGGRGGRGGDGYDTRTGSYSSFVDDPPPHSSSSRGGYSAMDDLDVGDGRQPPGERFGRSGVGREGGRSSSPHLSSSSYATAAAPPRGSYGSLATASETSSSDFRRTSISQQQDDKSQQLEEGEDPGYPVTSNSVVTSMENKRRREDTYAGSAGQSVGEHAKRQARDYENEEGLVLPEDLAPPSNATRANVIPAQKKEGIARLADEGSSMASTLGISPRDSPYSERRRYNGNQFDESSEPPLRSYDDSMHDNKSSYRDLGGFGGRGRGRGSMGRGRGPYRGGGRGESSGGRYGDRDRHLSIAAPSEGRNRGGPPELSPRGSYSQYSDLGSTSASTSSSWRRHDDDGGPQPSPRGDAGDWRRTSNSSLSQRTPVISSYATLAANPMPPANPSPRPKPASTTVTKEKVGAPASTLKGRPAPIVVPKKKVISPPPSPGPPSGLTVALGRLADLESQVEFEFAKYIMLAKRHKVLIAQYEHLEGLPVGVEAFENELNALSKTDTTDASDDNVSHDN